MTPTNPPGQKAEELSSVSSALTAIQATFAGENQLALRPARAYIDQVVAIARLLTAQLATLTHDRDEWKRTAERLERELAEAKHLLSVAQSANAEIMHGMSSQLKDAESERDALRAQVAKLRAWIESNKAGMEDAARKLGGDPTDIGDYGIFTDPTTPNLVAIDRKELALIRDSLKECRDYIEADYVEHLPPIPPPEPTDADWRVSMIVERADRAIKSLKGTL